MPRSLPRLASPGALPGVSPPPTPGVGPPYKEYQKHDGAVDHDGQGGDDSLYVAYNYDNTASSGELTKAMRLKSVQYPDGRLVHYTYGDADSSTTHAVNDALSRLFEINDDNSGDEGAPFAQYSYNGIGRLVVVDYPEPDLKLDYYQSTPGSYAGFDRFGRVVDQRWDDYTPTAAIRDRFQYAYDYASNRTYRDNTLTTGRDQYYTYDDLHRLTKFNRGTLSSGTITDGSADFNKQWSDLDALGNWAEVKWDPDGGGDTWVTQDRLHNLANEIDDDNDHSDARVDSIDSASAAGDWWDPVYDAAGNLTQAPQPGNETTGMGGGTEQRYTYDAWNRLVAVEIYDTDHWDDVATYEYDGLHRRIEKVITSGGVTYDDYYNVAWQLLETRKGGDTDPYKQYVWDVRYIDAPVCRFYDPNVNNNVQTHYYMTDANMNVTAIAEDDGDIVERYDYDPYGKVIVLNADWTLDSSSGGDGLSDVDNDILFAGYRFDPESGMYHVRFRVYHPTLGRWMQRDPLGYVDGMSLYEYVRSRSTRMSDPFGLFEGDGPMRMDPGAPGGGGGFGGMYGLPPQAPSCPQGEGAPLPDPMPLLEELAQGLWDDANALAAAVVLPTAEAVETLTWPTTLIPPGTPPFYGQHPATAPIDAAIMALQVGGPALHDLAKDASDEAEAYLDWYFSRQ